MWGSVATALARHEGQRFFIRWLQLFQRTDVDAAEPLLQESVREFASDFVAELCRRLIEGGAPGLHFYTLNLARPSLAVLQRLA